MIKQARHAVLPVVALGSTGLRRTPSTVILAAACSILCAAAAQASPVSPLPASDYTVQSACAAPARRARGVPGGNTGGEDGGGACAHPSAGHDDDPCDRPRQRRGRRRRPASAGSAERLLPR